MLLYGLPPEFEKKYELQGFKPLGGGTYGQVHRVKHKESQIDYAAKLINIARLPERELLDYTREEVILMRKLTENNCKNIIRFIESFETQEFIVIIMELSDGSLERIFQQQSHEFTFQVSLYILIQISIGIKSLHDRNTMHRDLKLANIMVNKNGQNNILKYEIKLIDFGFSKALQQEELAQTYVGTESTMAPEVLNGQKYHLPADIYSLGVICFQLMTGSQDNEQITSSDPDTREFLTYVKQHMLCEQSQRDQISQVIKHMESKVVKLKETVLIPEQNDDQSDDVKIVVKEVVKSNRMEEFKQFIPSSQEEHESDISQQQDNQLEREEDRIQKDQQNSLLNRNIDQDLENPNPNPNPDQNPDQNLEQNPDQKPDQNPDQNLDQNPDQNLDQNADQNLDQNADQNLDQNADQNPDQNLDQNADQNPDQNQDQNPDQNLDQNADQNPYQNQNPPPTKFLVYIFYLLGVITVIFIVALFSYQFYSKSKAQGLLSQLSQAFFNQIDISPLGIESDNGSYEEEVKEDQNILTNNPQKGRKFLSVDKENSQQTLGNEISDDESTDNESIKQEVIRDSGKTPDTTSRNMDDSSPQDDQTLSYQKPIRDH